MAGNDSGYIPKYADGKIVVCFKEADVNDSENFMQGFGAHLDYDFIEKWRWSSGNSIGVYKTDVGKEDEVISYFKSIEFVQWAERLDSRLEERTEGIESVVDDLRELDDNLEISQLEYKQKLDEIVLKIKQLYEI